MFHNETTNQEKLTNIHIRHYNGMQDDGYACKATRGKQFLYVQLGDPHLGYRCSSNIPVRSTTFNFGARTRAADLAEI